MYLQLFGIDSIKTKFKFHESKFYKDIHSFIIHS